MLQCERGFITCLRRWQLCYLASLLFHRTPGGILEIASGAERNCGKREGGYLSLDTKGEKRRTPYRWAIERGPKGGEMSELGVPGRMLLNVCANPLCSLHKEQIAHKCCQMCEFYRGIQRRGQRANILVTVS